MASQPVCFTCSQPVGDPPKFNRMASGEACPTCRDRLLDTLPALLPQPVPALSEGPPEEESPPEEGYEASPDEGFPDGPIGA